jgi:hypothetical protein
MRMLSRWLIAVFVLPAIGLGGLWAGLALWFQAPGPPWLRAAFALVMAAVTVTTAVLLFGRARLAAALAFTCLLGLVALWWSTILPTSDKDWAPDVARQVTGRVEGDILVLDGVRDFDWRSETDATARWETRRYDLNELRTLDLFLSYWAGPEMAHVILSFGFADGRYLAWSIEVRRTKSQVYAPVAGAFKANELVIIAADERDVVRVRSNIRGEDVQLYRLRTPPDIRALLLEYVADANALAEKPAFYNSITTNCSTVVIKMMRALGTRIPFDWRLIVNGFLPDYIYDHGAVDTKIPLSELRALSHIDQRALAAGDSPEFSQEIRVGVPMPP